MKKAFYAILSLILCVSCLFSASAAAETAVKKAIAEAASLEWNDLLEKAKAEIGDNELIIYSNTSRVNEETFTEKTGIRISTRVLDDSQIYEFLESETGKGINGPDVVLPQDSYMLLNTAIAKGWLENYVPESVKGSIPESDQFPLVCVYYNRLFLYNNGGDPELKRFTNVWQFTEPEFGNIEFKNPLEEKTSMNFLISLTDKKWQQKLAEAYRKRYGTEYAPSGDFENISYEWIYKFLANCEFTSKDSTIAANIAEGSGGSAGLFVFSKLRSVDASRISICAKDGMEGFGGLLYPIYIMVASNSRFPYASCLYINYLTSAEGYRALFGRDMGSYSANLSIGISENAESFGDEPLDYWRNCLVIEDAKHIQEVYTQAFDRISEWCADR